MINSRQVSGILKAIEGKTSKLPQPVKIMEVCGTHTMVLYRYGLTPMLMDIGVQMISGPGCPVCITPDFFHDLAINLVSSRENLILTTFGDMTRVPTRSGSIQKAVPAPGSRIKIVYSPEQALEEARQHKNSEVVFFGAGFETTCPSIAYVIKKAAEENIKNFSVLPALWLIPPALRAILESAEVDLDGFLYPGHVSTIIGVEPYRFIADEFKIPGAIAGFEPSDIMLAIISVLDQILTQKPQVALEYSRVVRKEGNLTARTIMAEVLFPYNAAWRGLGEIPSSGLLPKKSFSRWNALEKYELKLSKSSRQPLPGCRCGEVLKGILEPKNCPLFGKACTQESPQGPCMVSFEGACFIYYKFGRGGKINEKHSS